MSDYGKADQETIDTLFAENKRLQGETYLRGKRIDKYKKEIEELVISSAKDEERIAELKEDLRISNENLEKVEKWQDKMTQEYPIVAERITKLLGEGE